MTSSMTS